MFGRATIRLGIGPHSSLGFCNLYEFPVDGIHSFLFWMKTNISLFAVPNNVNNNVVNYFVFIFYRYMDKKLQCKFVFR